jgi:Ca2+-binding EF-hand superfamily protein
MEPTNEKIENSENFSEGKCMCASFNALLDSPTHSRTAHNTVKTLPVLSFLPRKHRVVYILIRINSPQRLTTTMVFSMPARKATSTKTVAQAKISTEKSDLQLIIALHRYFQKMGKSNVQGFYFIDKDNSRRVSAKEIKGVLAEAGHEISIGRAKDLIRGHNSYSSRSGGYFSGELDISAFIRLMGSGAKQIKTKDEKSDMQLIIALHTHFRRMGKSNVQGFHYIDKDNDRRISAKEIKGTLAEAGHEISICRAKDLIQGHNSYSSRSDGYFSGELDVPAFIRLMASAHKGY